MDPLVRRAGGHSLDAQSHEVEEVSEVVAGLVNQFEDTLAFGQLCNGLLIIALDAQSPQLPLPAFPY